MDLKPGFENLFGEDEKSAALLKKTVEYYKNKKGSFYNLNNLSNGVKLLGEFKWKGMNPEAVEAALYLIPMQLHDESFVKSSAPKGIFKILSGKDGVNSDVLHDIQLFYFTCKFKKCWQEILKLEMDLSLLVSNSGRFEFQKEKLKKLIKAQKVFKTKSVNEEYGQQALANVEKAYDWICRLQKYKPSPYDTSDVVLPAELNELLEDMSENIHENWSQLRLSQGWKYGLDRNDKLKTHPCLIPYEFLSEIEKDYDRQTAMQTLKFIIARDYKVLPPEVEVFSELPDESELNKLSVKGLLELQSKLKSQRNSDPEDFLKLGRSFQKRAEKVLAYETFQKGLKRLRGDKKSHLFRDMMFHAARALADCYAYREAEKLLRELHDLGFDDGDVTGQLAKIRKTLALKLNDKEHLNDALQYYKEGFDKAKDKSLLCKDKSKKWYSLVNEATYNGINTATMYMLSGDNAGCEKTVGEVLSLCSGKEPEKLSYWDYATMGEACLLEGKIELASKHYSTAASQAPQGDQQSMLSQAKIICQYLQLSTGWLSDVFVTPATVVFSGHSIDLKGEYRFPPEDEKRVTKDILGFINKVKPGFAYTCANSGSEIIFIEQMLKKGAEVHIFLPFEEKHFVEALETYGKKWRERFEKIRNELTSITVTGTFDEGLNEANRHFNNRYMTGLALLKSQSSNCSLKALTLWDGIKGKKPGRVAGAVDLWEKIEIDIEIIKTKGSQSLKNSSNVKYPQTKVEESLCMLFADVKGYSKLAGEQLIMFTNHFMGRSDKIISEYEDSVLVRRSQGDGLFIVFKSTEAAIQVSVNLKDMVLTTDWESLGLPADLTARFALDTGPCYSFIDPIARQLDLSGAHVIRAARLEPVTPPGHIFASEGFAAVCTANGLQDHFELAGLVQLPKNYGEMRVYYLDKK